MKATATKTDEAKEDVKPTIDTSVSVEELPAVQSPTVTEKFEEIEEIVTTRSCDDSPLFSISLQFTALEEEKPESIDKSV